MYNDYSLLLPVIFPIAAGIIIFIMAAGKAKRTAVNVVALISMLAEAALMILCLVRGGKLFLWQLTEGINIVFNVDGISRIFGALCVVVWLLVGIFAFEYTEHDEHVGRFFGFYVISEGFLASLAFAGNILTYYIFFEFLTLSMIPLVVHNLNHEAIMAGLKYLFYSVAGAFMALIGVMLLVSFGDLGEFAAGGILDPSAMETSPGIVCAAMLLCIIGFGTKAGMLPMHGWLPTAHPEAPAPASAVLSGIITKSGVVAVIRMIYYVIGADTLRGTWVQTVWMILSLSTVFMGSMLAYKENGLKKRLAYSTVSQVSYILFGLSVLHPLAFAGAIAHIVYHSLVKNTLFLGAGAIIHKTGKTKVSELRGIGKEMPVTIWCFTLVSITLIGIPPTSGFISKWYLAQGALASGIPVFSWLGPVVLLVSALLTAGYLLPVTIRGFFPGNDYDYGKLVQKEPTYKMLIPMIIMTAAAVIMGIFPGTFLKPVLELAASLM